VVIDRTIARLSIRGEPMVMWMNWFLLRLRLMSFVNDGQAIPELRVDRLWRQMM
jgi:hypothetical protein